MTTFTSLEQYQFYREFLGIKEESHPLEFEKMFTSAAGNSQKMKADLFFAKQKESTKFTGERKNAYFWLVADKLLLTSQNI